MPRLVQHGRGGAVRLELEHRLDDRAVGAGADEIGLGPGPHHEEDGVDHDGLSRPGLAGDDVEAGSEGHGHRLDDREILQAQLAQHAREFLAARSHPRAIEDTTASRIRLETAPETPTARPT